MTATADLLAQTERLRCRTLDLLSQMEEHGQRLGLPPFPDLLQFCRQKLQENIYRVLVVGEAKRGKSSFINALVGRDLLPVDVDVATCQVFRIRQAAQEAYRLRFEDDSEQVIRAEDLPRYGSQVLADLGEVPRLDQIIRWIEVDVPAPFLPPNLWLLDTPGLGSLYAFHAQITYRFVPQCDGVIYVLDSQAPISQPELQFIEDLLKVTNYLFFIQTKIDLFDQDAWQKILQRNEDILRQRFGDKLGQVRVWPVSNQLLRKASETKDEDYLEASKYKELAETLQLFLYRIAGLAKTRATAALGIEHHRSCRQVLQQRLDNLKAESKEKQKELQQQLRKRQEQFEADWGLHGKRRHELLDKVWRTCQKGIQSMRQKLAYQGELYHQWKSEIQQLSSMEEIKHYSRTLSNNLAAEVHKTWNEVIEDVQKEIAAVLDNFQAALPVANIPLSKGGPALAKSGNWMEEIGAIFKGAKTGMLGGALLAALAHVAVPILVVFTLIGGFIGGFLNWLFGRAREVQRARQELQKHLDRVFEHIRQQYLSLGGEVERFFSELQNGLREYIDRLASRAAQQSRAEIQRLKEDAQLEEQARRGENPGSA
jgi:GTPase SAR1 family protein